MKWIYRLFTLGILSAAIIGPFFLKTQNGQPVIEMPSVDDFIPDQIIPDSLMPGSGQPSDAAATSSTGKTFYKWQDEHGNWHYGDQPPVGGPKVSTLQVDTNANIIQSFKIEPEEEDESLPNQPAQAKLPERLGSGELTLDSAVNIMDDAKAVAEMMNSRNEQLKTLSGK